MGITCFVLFQSGFFKNNTSNKSNVDEKKMSKELDTKIEEPMSSSKSKVLNFIEDEKEILVLDSFGRPKQDFLPSSKSIGIEWGSEEEKEDFYLSSSKSLILIEEEELFKEDKPINPIRPKNNK
jgi:hypothetical protein